MENPKYKYIEKKGKKYLLVGAHRDGNKWYYDFKDCQSGEFFNNIPDEKVSKLLNK